MIEDLETTLAVAKRSGKLVQVDKYRRGDRRNDGHLHRSAARNRGQSGKGRQSSRGSGVTGCTRQVRLGGGIYIASGRPSTVTIGMAAPIIEATVTELLSTVQGLLKDEEDRATSLNARASGLTGFVGIILSLAAAAGAATGKDAGAGLHHGVRVLTGVLVASALVMLALAVVLVVARVLLPTPSFTIATDEATRYPTWEFISQEHVMIQGRLMRGSVITLTRDRERNALKAKWLRRSSVLVCTGLLFVASAGVAGTLDRYVA